MALKRCGNKNNINSDLTKPNPGLSSWKACDVDWSSVRYLGRVQFCKFKEYLQKRLTSIG